MPRFVTHLEGAIDGTRLPADQLATLHKDRPIWVRYDLPAVAKHFSKEVLNRRPETLWRYRELLPYFDESDVVSLGERMTPLLRLPAAGREVRPRATCGSRTNRSCRPAASRAAAWRWRSRMAKHFGVKRVAIPTAGNAGGAAAAYAARAGLECFVFMPDDTPVINQYEVPPGRREDVSRQRPDHRLRPDRPRRQASSWAGSTCPRSRSRIASKARRRWAWSWPSSSTGSCPT